MVGLEFQVLDDVLRIEGVRRSKWSATSERNIAGYDSRFPEIHFTSKCVWLTIYIHSFVLNSLRYSTVNLLGLLRCRFREKASKDVDDVYGYCQEVIQRSGPNNRVTIRQEDVRLFCKEAYNLCLIRGRPIHAELESSPAAILHELCNQSFLSLGFLIFFVMTEL